MDDRDRIDAAVAATVIREQFAELEPDDIRWLGEGYDSVAFEVGGEWVFRFPKRDDVEQQLLVEMRLLPVLARYSPLRVWCVATWRRSTACMSSPRDHLLA